MKMDESLSGSNVKSGPHKASVSVVGRVNILKGGSEGSGQLWLWNEGGHGPRKTDLETS